MERGAGMIHAAAMGVVLSLLAMEPEDRDPGLSEATHEAIPTAITTAGSDKETTEGDRREKAANRAVAMKAVFARDGGQLHIRRANPALGVAR